MQSVLIVIHLLVVIALVAVVLLQRSEGGALGAGGGGGFMTGRGQANALSRATAILGGLFFASALLMSILAGWNRAPRSILDTQRAVEQGLDQFDQASGAGQPARSTQIDGRETGRVARRRPPPRRPARRPGPRRAGARAEVGRRASANGRRRSMSAPLSIAVYFTIWWVVLFAILPIGVRSMTEAGVTDAPPGVGSRGARGARISAARRSGRRWSRRCVFVALDAYVYAQGWSDCPRSVARVGSRHSSARNVRSRRRRRTLSRIRAALPIAASASPLDRAPRASRF